MTSDSNYRFGGFELLVRQQLLRHAGAPVCVGSRALAILTVLVEGVGELVAKEKLIAAGGCIGTADPPPTFRRFRVFQAYLNASTAAWSYAGSTQRFREND